MAQQQRSVGLGIGAGIAAGVLGAVLWAIITSAVNARIGYLALGVGALVGLAVGKLGKGPENGPLPILAGVIALVSVAIGDTFGWASASSDEAQEAGLDIGSLDLVKGLLTNELTIDGQTLPVDVRDIYSEDFDVFVLLMVALGVFAAFSLCRRFLAEAAQPAPLPPVPGAPTGQPVDGPTAPHGQAPQAPQAPEGPPSLEKRPPS